MQHPIKILIVEDEMSTALELEMLVEELEYELIGLVDNGEEALTMVFEKSPHLIMMDISIKGKYSGLEVAEKISHLPVAILFITSYDSQEVFDRAKLTNFAGYLTKPVNKLSIQGAVEMAIKFLNYSHPIRSASINPTSKKEDIFIIRFKKLIFDNLEHSDLSVGEIAKDMGISRMQLHRKIKALTNQTTSEFIKNIRLNVAYKLLEEKELNISEIAYQTGFSHPNHFSRIFKNKYGIAPSKVKK